MQHITYTPHGVCARQIDIDVENGIITAATFTGGCSGNTKGVTALLIGMNVNEAIKRLEGIRCGSKHTSCPDQLACALKEFVEHSA
ncbi:MAG: TIGR03905 family TSCPD domain-containing protein [Clostridia bacterium]|nr:TIGR03905 family TSCPD domain-containing protein [Clostridia bacterium]